jgi:hypothetical protein
LSAAGYQRLIEHVDSAFKSWHAVREEPTAQTYPISLFGDSADSGHKLYKYFSIEEIIRFGGILAPDRQAFELLAGKQVVGRTKKVRPTICDIYFVASAPFFAAGMGFGFQNAGSAATISAGGLLNSGR